jgi:hypothetical protein
MTIRHPSIRSVLFATLVLAAACGSDDGAASSGEDGEVSIEIVSPADGADVGEPFDVEVEASVPFGEPDTGLHHWHLYYDGNTTEGEYGIADDGSTTFTVSGLSPGMHTLEAVIANADHSLTDARSEITVEVGEGTGGSGGSGDQEAPTTSAPGFDY